MSAVLKPDADASDASRILVVDDDQRLAESLRSLLTMHGHEVDVAFGGRSALHQLGLARYDVVLLDLAMPDVSGHDVLRYMQDMDANTLTIVVSGETSIDDVSRCV